MTFQLVLAVAKVQLSIKITLYLLVITGEHNPQRCLSIILYGKSYNSYCEHANIQGSPPSGRGGCTALNTCHSKMGPESVTLCQNVDGWITRCSLLLLYILSEASY
jgi:hypothetical protein